MKKKGVKIAAIGLFTGFVNGMFGSGGGSLFVPAAERYLEMEQRKTHATAIAVILPLSIVSTVVYYLKADMANNWTVIASVSAGGLLGGYLGAKWLTKIPKKLLGKVFGLFIIAAAVKMIV